MINFRRAYGKGIEISKAREWTRLVFGNMGQSIAEAIQFIRRFRNAESQWECAYEPENPELEQRLLQDPRPKIFVTAHLGSWEVAILMVSLRVGNHGAAVARRVDNPILNWVVRKTRMKYGSSWIDKRGAADRCLEWLERGKNVGLVMDENGGWRGIYVEYFGRPASTQKTAALLALKCAAPIVLGAAIRRPGKEFLYKLAVFEPSDYAGFPDPVWQMTQDVVRQQEAWVRADFLQWRWIHWRWKTRPGGTEETYTRKDLRRCFYPT
jgi:KDO2-lipid IV(A) lauroyltransferase